MNPHEPGNECPDCGTLLFSKRKCMQCGWKASDVKDDDAPEYSCWTCTKCGQRSPGQPTIMGLCGACHFDKNIRLFASRPEDVCDAPECAGQPRHAIRAHIEAFRAAMGKVETRNPTTRITL